MVDHSVSPTPSARNLGFIFKFFILVSLISSLLSLVHVSTTFVIFVASALFLTLIRLAPLADLLFTPQSTLDYCNCMLYCLLKSQFNRIQHTQNALAKRSSRHAVPHLWNKLLLFFVFFISLIHHHHPALLHRHALILDRCWHLLWRFLLSSSNPPFLNISSTAI